MKKILFSLAAIASLTLTACGGNYCDDSADAAKDLSKKAEECGITGTGVEEPTEEEINSCKTALDKCSDDDKKKLEAVSDCLKDVKGCSDKTQSEQQAFATRVIACASNAGGLSAACNAAFGE
jgi:hypothetical protein